MKLAPIEGQPRLYVRVARRIAELVANGEVKPGEKLPAERRLAEMLQVSRPTIREAMIALEVSGLIDVRTGSGIYVARQSHPQRITLDDEGIGPFELLELRLILEPQASALAAERITDEQLALLQEIFDEMRQFSGSPRVEEVDARFHVAIAEATENAAITQAVAMAVDAAQSERAVERLPPPNSGRRHLSCGGRAQGYSRRPQVPQR